MNEYSHLLNGSAEACLQPPRVGDASVMLNEDMGSSGNHFGSSLVTSTFAAARSAAAHGDDFTAFLRLHTLVTFLHLLLFPILIEDPEGNMVRSVDLYSFYIVYASILDRT